MVKWRTLVPQNHRYGKSCWSWFAERFCSAESFFKCHHFNLGTIWNCGKNWMWRNKWRGDLLEKLPQGHFTTCNWKCNGSKLPSSESTSVDCESDLFPKSSTGYMCVCVSWKKRTITHSTHGSLPLNDLVLRDNDCPVVVGFVLTYGFALDLPRFWTCFLAYQLHPIETACCTQADIIRADNFKTSMDIISRGNLDLAALTGNFFYPRPYRSKTHL